MSVEGSIFKIGIVGSRESIIKMMNAAICNAGSGKEIAEGDDVEAINLKLGEFIVSSAGIFTNLVLAFISAIAICIILLISLGNEVYPYGVALLGMEQGGLDLGYTLVINEMHVEGYLMIFFYLLGIINCSLAIFNLIPLYPLDGYRLFELFFDRLLGSRVISWLHNYGHYILYGVLILSAVLSNTLGFSPISAAANWLFGQFSLGAGKLIGLFV